MSGKFPGVPFSSFFLINYLPELDIVVSREHFLYIAEFIKGEKIENIPYKTLYIKLKENARADYKNVMKLKSELSSLIDTDTTIITDFQDIKKGIQQSIFALMLLFYIVQILLYLLTLY